MYCSNCGKEIQGGNTFCTNCGTSVEEQVHNNEVINNKQTIKPKNKVNIKLLILLLIIILTITGVVYLLVSNNKNNTNITNETVDENVIKNTNPIATITVKDYGTMKVELYPDKAPNTVKNFIALANNGFYDNLTFHRIIKGFIIQGGDPKGDGTGYATLSAINKNIVKGSEQDKEYAIEGEFFKNGISNDLQFEKGVIALARADYSQYGLTKEGYNSGCSQFFIMAEESLTLNGEYTAFGKVIEGYDVLEQINNVPILEVDVPKTPPVIESIRIDTKNIQYELPKTIDVFDIYSYIMEMYEQD